MKLRIKGDSLRLRLTQGEVRELEEHGEVTDRVRFAPGSELVYRLKRDAGVDTLTAAYSRDAIEVRVPDAVGRNWCATDLVTLEHSPPGGVRLLVEKDFACLAPRAGEDESDNFPHPGATPGG